MGRLKKDHTGWRTSGLWTKYQKPNVGDDTFNTIKSKYKNTRKWCKGKVGVEHNYQLVERHEGWLSFCQSKCVSCGKKKWH